MDLSIIIVTWNTADITLKCVQTIKKFLHNIKYEIIVADNGSIDDTVAKLKKEGGVVVIENKANLGFGKGNNIAAAKAKGDYLLFLNSDMELLDNGLKNMFDYINSHPNIGLIGPKFLNIDLSDQGSIFPPQTLSNAFKEFWLGQKTYSKYVPPNKEPIDVFSVSGGAVMVKRSLFEKIGGWDKRYFMFYEDLELCRQVQKLGYKVFYYPQCCLIHRHGASGKSLANAANQWRRLIPSSKIYHGLFKHYLLFLITWSGQKWQKIKHLFLK
ncbi:MAG: glycosyltransferase family 2 protein [Candidatus Shapirobacteria bacterium]|jgi:GT2 family glycosyltransferase